MDSIRSQLRRFGTPKMVAGDTTAPAVVFGSAPNPHVVEWRYDQGSAGRIREMCGRELPWYNLYEREPPRWDRAEAGEIATAWCQEHAQEKLTLLLLGQKVCDAFGIQNPEWLRWYVRPRVGRLERAFDFVPWIPMVAVPHPSGLNRWYNDPVNQQATARLLRKIAWGELPVTEVSHE